MIINKPKRQFVAENLSIDHIDKILPYFEELNARKLNDVKDLNLWLKDQSELEAILEEDLAWRYIKMTIDTTKPELSDAYSFFIQEINPKIAPFGDLLNKKLMSAPGKEDLAQDSAFHIYFRSVEKSITLFREENIALNKEIQQLSKEYGSISAAQTIEYKGETLTMQKAATFLKKQDAAVRKEVFELMSNRRAQDIDALNVLFDQLVQLRHQVAVNAGYTNFRDYKMDAMGRFDYSVSDCFDFHQAIKEHIVPITRKLQEEHANKLNAKQVKPWDLDVDPDGLAPLSPFEGGQELLQKSKEIFYKIDKYFGDCLETMDEMGHSDLESKNGKAPGGYNYPLYEIGVPFIFMNAAGAQRDVVTMIHEGGHAVHSFLSRELSLTPFKNLPSEVAELASMSMELLSMEHWSVFYEDKNDLKRAKKEQLEGILKVLPWIAVIDAFQHWIYENPNHSRTDREKQWSLLQEEYGNPLVDWSGYEENHLHAWQRQLHLFEVPFYYIEYGIAQLGALGVWKNSLEDKPKAIEAYKQALALGYTKSIPEIYETADIKFDFSSKNVQELAGFVNGELVGLD